MLGFYQRSQVTPPQRLAHKRTSTFSKQFVLLDTLCLPSVLLSECQASMMRLNDPWKKKNNSSVLKCVLTIFFGQVVKLCQKAATVDKSTYRPLDFQWDVDSVEGG